MRDQRAWTTSEVNVLRNLWGRVSAEDIAEELGRSKWSVYGQARSLGLEKENRTKTLWRPHEDAALKLLYSRGVSVDRIAEALHRSESAVKKRIERTLHD